MHLIIRYWFFVFFIYIFEVNGNPADKSKCTDNNSEGKPWKIYCLEISATCNDVSGFATCECDEDEAFDKRGICTDKSKCTDINSEGQSWTEFCSTLNARCNDVSGFATCECEENKAFDKAGICTENPKLPMKIVNVLKNFGVPADSQLTFDNQFATISKTGKRNRRNGVVNVECEQEDKNKCAADGKICKKMKNKPECECPADKTEIHGECKDECKNSDFKTKCENSDGRCVNEMYESKCMCPPVKIDINGVCKDTCNSTKQDPKNWRGYCEDAGGSCKEGDEGSYCECDGNKRLNTNTSKCEATITCNSLKTNYESWNQYCESDYIGKICKGENESIHCVCPENEILNPDTDKCEGKITCSSETKNKEQYIIFWNIHCKNIGGECKGENEGIHCECLPNKIMNPDTKICEDKITCGSTTKNGKTWGQHCGDIDGECKGENEDIHCECRPNKIMNPDTAICEDKIKCTSLTKNSKTWNKHCVDIGGICKGENENIHCECTQNKIMNPDTKRCEDEITCKSLTKNLKTWTQHCDYIGGYCKGKNENIHCECTQNRIKNPDTERCEDEITCDSLTKNSKTWKKHCEDIGGFCNGENVNIHCECTQSKIMNPDTGICEDKITCSSLTKNGNNWDKRCLDIGGICKGENMNIHCECLPNKIMNPDIKICEDKIKCTSLTKDGKTWNKHCEDIGGFCKGENINIHCECVGNKIMNPDIKICEDKITCSSITKNGNTWARYCEYIGGKCEGENANIKCECIEDKRKNPETKICEENTCDVIKNYTSHASWDSYCKIKELRCMMDEGEPTCRCPEMFTFNKITEKCTNSANRISKILFNMSTMQDNVARMIVSMIIFYYFNV